MERLKSYWKRIPKIIRQFFVLGVGSIVIGAGLLMLVLPGPGWAAIFLGFAILATEFTFAQKVRDWFVAVLKRLVFRLTQVWDRFIAWLKHKQ